MAWQNMIQGCFGLADREFAGHPSDEQRAFELLSELRENSVGWTEFETELRSQLSNMSKLHANDQVERVASFFRMWLLD